MSYLARTEMAKEGFKEIYKKYLAYYEASELSCGIILAKCKILSGQMLETVKKELEKKNPHIAAQYIYDGNKQICVILLDDQKLSDTHYHALIVKDYLLERNLLTGGIVVASFPESAASAVQLLIDMVKELTMTREVGEIKIYHHLQRKGGDAAKILVVDQDETVHEFLRIYLQRKGYHVEVASDGLAGVRLFQETAPDVVITELTLPGLNGYQLMETINHHGSSQIIVLTHKRLEEDVSKSFALGAADYITKPFSPIELEARVKRLISANKL